MDGERLTQGNPRREDQQPWIGLQSVQIRPWMLARVLAGISAGLVVGGAFANYAIYNLAPDPEHAIADVLKRFDLGHEPSIPAFYSAIVMLAAAAVLWFLGVYDPHGGRHRRVAWRALSIVMVALAIDEVAMFHEMGTAAMERLGINSPFHFSWVVPGGIFTCLIVICFSRLLFSLGRRTRALIVGSGVLFISGAIGMEIIAGLIFEAAESEHEALSSTAHVLLQAVEEGLEMLGMALFLCTLLDYVNQTGLSVWLQRADNDAMEVSGDP